MTHNHFARSDAASVMAVAAAGTIGGAVGGASIMVLWLWARLINEGFDAIDADVVSAYFGIAAPIAALIGAFLGGFTGLGAGVVTVRHGFPRRITMTTVPLGALVGWIGLAVVYPVLFQSNGTNGMVHLRLTIETLVSLIGVSGAIGGAIGGLVGGWCLGWMPHSIRP